jgi:hypothetical protein
MESQKMFKAQNFGSNRRFVCLNVSAWEKMEAGMQSIDRLARLLLVKPRSLCKVSDCSVG